MHIDGEARGGFSQRVLLVSSSRENAPSRMHNCCRAQTPAVLPQPLSIAWGLTSSPSPPLTATSQEVSILSKLSHSNVVRFIGACTTRPNLCIVCELMPGGSVSDLLRRVRKGVMPEWLRY